jgi:hypothetical protein
MEERAESEDPLTASFTIEKLSQSFATPGTQGGGRRASVQNRESRRGSLGARQPSGIRPRGGSVSGRPMGGPSPDPNNAPCRIGASCM